MKRVDKLVMSAGLSILAVVYPQPVFASDEALTSIFTSPAFSGSMETISKLNWVGWLLSGIISVFCLVGLFLTVFRIMTSLMYLSGRNVFDKIHEIKTANTGNAFGLAAVMVLVPVSMKLFTLYSVCSLMCVCTQILQRVQKQRVWAQTRQ